MVIHCVFSDDFLHIGSSLTFDILNTFSSKEKKTEMMLSLLLVITGSIFQYTEPPPTVRSRI